MRIFEMLDVDYEPWGLIKVDVPLTGSYEERQKLESNMDVAVQAISQNEYQRDDYMGADDLLNGICEKLNELGYEAERFYLEQINMI